jgi:hypothetical protein
MITIAGVDVAVTRAVGADADAAVVYAAYSDAAEDADAGDAAAAKEKESLREKDAAANNNLIK